LDWRRNVGYRGIPAEEMGIAIAEESGEEIVEIRMELDGTKVTAKKKKRRSREASLMEDEPGGSGRGSKCRS
jgi:hypothetical protein